VTTIEGDIMSKSQQQIYREQQANIARGNETFLHITETLTREELVSLIEMRPELWGRFRQWVDVLPSKED
jgi:hypothetical protein